MKTRIIQILLCSCLFCVNSLISQEAPPTPTDDLNWISSITYNINGQTLSKGVGYFNSLGKATQSQSWDVLSGKVWASETLYDYHGRPALQTLSAPINSTGSFGLFSDFIKDSDNSPYTPLDFDTGLLIDNPKTVYASSTLGSYYFNSSSNQYQDNTAYPFSRTVFSKLNPGAISKVLGGNKINDEWLQSYTFSMPAGQELSSAEGFGNNASQYDSMKITKTVSRDVHGVEAVVFTDSDGNTIAAARSGNEEQNVTPINTYVFIKEQGFVDIHIPVGCTGVTISNPESIELQIYNLVTDSHFGYTTLSTSLPSGFYRIAARYPETFVYNENQPIRVTHTVNYYDYNLNYFDKSGRLLKSIQPNGSQTSFKSAFSYNSLGQLLETSSPDEGSAQFIYRKDGQIRFSQNSKQADNDEFSYTNYDNYGRPVESGVYRSDDIPFYIAPETTETSTGNTQQVLAGPITPVHVQNVLISNSNSVINYTKTFVLGLWNSGLVSQEVLQEDGYLSFKQGLDGQLTPINDYEVVVGFTPPQSAAPAAYTNIKYGISLLLSTQAGLNSIRIYENGDYLRDGNNQIIHFGVHTANDVFKIKRASGVITYEKNNVVFHTTSDNYIQPLVVDTSFKYSGNGINSLLLLQEPVTAVQSSLDIQTIVNELDGLNDVNCFEQNFTLYDIPDSNLSTELGLCGLPSMAYKQTFLSGNVSKTHTQSLETTTTWYSYDVYGRVKWLIQKINGLSCLKTIDYKYDPITGQVIEVDYQRNDSNERFVHKYEYNIGGQLVNVNTSTDHTTFTLQARYEYNETGQLIRTELADKLQGIDYIYNLNGQLKAINHPSLNPANDPEHDGNNDFIADVFGMTIQYYDGDYTRTSTPTPITSINASTPDQFNGNIQAIQWQNQSGQPSTYAYEYNKNNWLKEAQFSNSNSSNSEDYKVNNLTYDANGNIITLKRNGFTDSNGGSNAMDDFTYVYNSQTNQLNHVEDSNDNTDVTRYNDLRNQAPDNYIYNNIGQLVINSQDNIMYEYNASGLVTKINEVSDTSTNNYYTLYFEDFEDDFWSTHNSWNIQTGIGRIVHAHQDDLNDLYSDGGSLFPPGINEGHIKIPPYCIGFDQNATYESRLQFNFFEHHVNAVNDFKIQSSLKTVEGAYHKLEFDLFLFQKQLLIANPFTGTPADVPINAGATIKLTQEDGTVIEILTIDPQNYSQTYCDRIVEHLNFGFTATGSQVIFEIDIDNDGDIPTTFPVPNSTEAMRTLYQSAEIDNIHLQVANAPKLAFFYNDRGQRVRKESYDNLGNTSTTYYVRDVAGSPMAIYQGYAGPTVRVGPPEAKEYPVYGASRIGVFYKVAGSKSGGNYVYQLTDHLGNVRAVIMKDGVNALSLTSKTDYYPFGMPMPNRNLEGNYRYGYQGGHAEKEAELGGGINSFQLRLWDSRIGRWLTTDPYGQYHSPYLGMGNNPITRIDHDGGCDGTSCTCNGETYSNQTNELGEVNITADLSDIADRIANQAYSFNIMNGPMVGVPIGIPIIDGVTFWSNNKGNFRDTGRKRRDGEEINETYTDFQNGMPNGGGAQVTKWANLANDGDNAVEIIQYVSSVAGHVDNLSGSGVAIAPPNNNIIKTKNYYEYVTNLHTRQTDSFPKTITFKGVESSVDYSIDSLDNAAANEKIFSLNYFNTD